MGSVLRKAPLNMRYNNNYRDDVFCLAIFAPSLIISQRSSRVISELVTETIDVSTVPREIGADGDPAKENVKDLNDSCTVSLIPYKSNVPCHRSSSVQDWWGGGGRRRGGA